MNSIVGSLAFTAAAAAVTTLFVYARRSDWYLNRTAAAVLKSRREQVTPEGIAELVPWMKVSLTIGIVIGVAMTILSAVGLVIGLATGWSQSCNGCTECAKPGASTM